MNISRIKEGKNVGFQASKPVTVLTKKAKNKIILFLANNLVELKQIKEQKERLWEARKKFNQSTILVQSNTFGQISGVFLRIDEKIVIDFRDFGPLS